MTGCGERLYLVRNGAHVHLFCHLSPDHAGPHTARTSLTTGFGVLSRCGELLSWHRG